MKKQGEAFGRYRLNTSEITIEGTKYTTYGISGKQTEIKDVSVNRAFVEELIERINEEELEECHLSDVVEDSIC